jgi:formate/nitrite transporter FocA (FNT family)
VSAGHQGKNGHKSVPEPSERSELEFQVPYRQILRHEMDDALREFDRPRSGLLMSGLSAGLDIGFGPLLMAVYLTLGPTDPGGPTSRLVLAGLYSIGFLAVVIGRSELFTEHTTMAVLPVLAGDATFRQLLEVWSLVWVGNLAGVLGFSALISFFGPELGIVEPAALEEVASVLTGHSWWVIFVSAVLAGWMMGLLTWLVGAAKETISQILIVVIIAGAIGFVGLHHSIAGSVEVLFGVFTGSSGLEFFFVFLVWATIGNAVGGSVFVALLKYAHVVRSEPEPVEQQS